MKITLRSVTVNDQARAVRLPMGPVTVAVFDDTCGSLIRPHQAGKART